MTHGPSGSLEVSWGQVMPSGLVCRPPSPNPFGTDFMERCKGAGRTGFSCNWQRAPSVSAARGRRGEGGGRGHHEVPCLLSTPLLESASWLSGQLSLVSTMACRHGCVFSGPGYTWGEALATAPSLLRALAGLSFPQVPRVLCLRSSVGGAACYALPAVRSPLLPKLSVIELNLFMQYFFFK